MSDKYRMEDVFDLPVTIRDEDMIRTNISHVGGQFETPELAQAAVHAINTHDDMYKALEELMLAVTMEGMDGCFVSSMEDAEAALKKARGE